MSDRISSIEETVVNGDIVTTTTETKTINFDHSITTLTTIDKTDHADDDNHMTTISETTIKSSDLDEKIIRQIEYYFSDININRDKYLQNEITKDDGWISLSILITFKRLQLLTTDFNIIFNALNKSSSGLLQLNERENKIRRHPNRPLPNNQSEFQSILRNRTVYVKGFPQTTDTTLDKLLKFFQKYDSIDNIQMKKDFKTNNFNGIVIISFSNQEKAQQFIENSQEIPIKYDDNSILECSLQDDYLKNKSFQLINNTNDKQINQQELQNIKINKHLEKLNTKNLTGALIHLSGISTNVTPQLIKDKFNPFTNITSIDFNQGDSQAWIRLNEANTAKDILDKILLDGNGKFIIGDNQITTRIVQGDEEIRFWKQSNEKQAIQRTQTNQ